MSALTDEVIKSLTAEQKKNLVKIYDLAIREGQVCEKIEKMFKKGFRYEPHGDGLALSICENEDDFRVMNAFKPAEEQHPLYRERNEVRESIRETLRESLKLDLGHLGVIQRHCKNYGVELSKG
jgi:hypothetical protein